MGVPKFFRYISERYPCLSEIIKEYQIPEFDNLYLDMNGIIHTCSHPDDTDPHFRITEEKIFQDIFHYIEILFRMIKPQKLFFMAVDGVAPRAKMNQQRGRRFRSAKDAQDLEEKAKNRGEELPKEARFDSNCITPGTEFMAKLHEQLKYFVVNKISTDPLWQKCKIILSGHETPGEGEHKIMDYIRYMRSQPGYDPHTRHCLYGLDADLIMLGLCTHEPHFALLREEVKFGRKSTKQKCIPEEMTFYLLHLSLLREYLELEFLPLKNDLPFVYDLEHIIDDWVLMGFLVGNDFIPHLPGMHIAGGALPDLYKAYMKVLPRLGGYINESGILNLDRFEKFMQALSEIDLEKFSDQYTDLKYFESKTGRKLNERKKPEKLPKFVENKHLDIHTLNSEFTKLFEPQEEEVTSTAKLSVTDCENEIQNNNEREVEITGEYYIVDSWEDHMDNSGISDSEDDLFLAEFKQHKTDYYMNKLEYESVTPEVLKSQAEGYVRAIQWNLHYYYNGVCSWSWYYPHHYAPYISDIKGFGDLKIEFELGKPFKPFEQLLAVLPAASKSLLPKAYQDLMTSETSPIKSYYPEKFKTDLNGKRNEWEAVVLIPFIDETNLLEAMEACNEKLTPEEQKRNSHGPMLIYQYTKDDLGLYQAPQYFPHVKRSHALCKEMTIEDIRVPVDKLIKGVYPGINMEIYYPGFPTMKHIEYTASLEKAKVRVFEQPSRNESMIVKVKQKSIPILDELAKNMLGNTVFVSWPHLVEAIVVSVSNNEYSYHSTGVKGQYNVEENKRLLLEKWKAQVNGITEHYKDRWGIDVGNTEVLVHVKTMIGRKYVFTPHGRVNLEKQWSEKVQSVYPFQTVVQNIPVYDTKYTMYKDIGSVFPVGSQCFMLGQPHYGAMGEVLESKESLKRGRIDVSMRKSEEPDLTEVKQYANELLVRYMPLHIAAIKLSVSKSLFSRITGSIFVIHGSPNSTLDINETPKTNIGLNLKFNKKNEETPGYTKKDGTTWLYSEKAVKVVQDYLQLYPPLIEYLNQNINNDVFYETDIFPNGNGKEMLKEITAWLKGQTFYSVERKVCGSSTLEPDVVKRLEQVVDQFNARNAKIKKIMMQVKPHLLYKVGLQVGNIMPDPTTTFQLYDRIVNVRESYTIPVGLKGTIIAIHKSPNSKEDETVYDVVFDQEFAGGLQLNCSPNRGYRLPGSAVINISHGIRIMNQKTGVRGHLLQSTSGQNPTTSNGVLPHVNQYHPQNTKYAGWNNLHYNYTNPQPPNLNQFHPNFNNNPPPLFAQQNLQRPMYNFNAFAAQNPQHTQLHHFNNKTVPFDSQKSPNQLQPSYSFNNKHVGKPQSSSNQSYATNQSINSGPYNVKLPQNTFPFPHTPTQNCQNTFVPGFMRGAGTRTHLEQGREVSVKPQNAVASASSGSNDTNKQESSKVTKQKSALPCKVDTDLLRKMLKINEARNQSITSKNERRTPGKMEETTPLNIQDIFDHARNQEEQKISETFYTAQLLSHYQALALGCPRYQYFELEGKKYQAQITLHDGKTIFGIPANSKDNAANAAAAEALKYLNKNEDQKQSKESTPSKKKDAPCLSSSPPRKTTDSKSQEIDNKKMTTNTSSKVDVMSKTVNQLENLHLNKSEFPKYPTVPKYSSQRSNDENYLKDSSKSENSKKGTHVVKEQRKPLTTSSDKDTSPPKQNLSAFTSAAPFIPLQAIKPRTKSLSNTNFENKTLDSDNQQNDKNEDKVKDKKLESCEKGEVVTKTAEETKNSSEGRVRRKRERKMRIAANFQAARVS